MVAIGLMTPLFLLDNLIADGLEAAFGLSVGLLISGSGAALVYAYDSDGPLPADLEEFLLESYFGTVQPVQRERLAGMKFMLLFFTAMWGLMQHGAQMHAIIPFIEDFDCLDYARGTFDSLRANFTQLEKPHA